MTNEPQTQTAIRLPNTLLERIDKIAERVSESSGIPITRAEVLRLAALRGVRQLEEAHSKGGKRKR